jgi:DNA/RNA endonuclease YhcR with UshA esterase domain
VLKRTVCLLVLAVLACGSLRADDAPATQPATQPAVIPVTDTAAIRAKNGQTITIEGVIESAKWSGSGKVMNVRFKDVKDGVSVAVFQKNKDKFDAAFGGDTAKKFTGAKVQVTGALKDFKGRPEIVIENPEQVTIVEAAK